MLAYRSNGGKWLFRSLFRKQYVGHSNIPSDRAYTILEDKASIRYYCLNFEVLQNKHCNYSCLCQKSFSLCCGGKFSNRIRLRQISPNQLSKVCL
jgi:hypothetical protein